MSPTRPKPPANSNRLAAADLLRLKAELRSVAERHGLEGQMPSQPMLYGERLFRLTHQVRRFGGYKRVAEMFGWRTAGAFQQPVVTKPYRYWRDFENLKAALLSFVEEHGTPGIMPRKRLFTKHRRYDIIHAIETHHGGYAEVGRMLGLKALKPKGYWKDFENVAREIQAFIVAHGSTGRMPSGRDFQRFGRHDLNLAVFNHGGYLAVARRMGLLPARSRVRVSGA